MSTIVQEITIYQQNFYQTVRKVSLVSQALDGKLLSGNVPRVYNITGTDQVSAASTSSPADTLDELRDDFRTFIDVLPDFNELITVTYAIANNAYYDGIFETDYDSVLSDDDKPFFIIMARILDDKSKKEEFEKALVKGIENDNQLVRRVNRVVDNVADRFSKELKNEEKYFKKFKKSSEYNPYVDGLDELLYVKGKLRKCEYDTTPDANVTANGEKIKDLYLNPFKFK
jgi:hypothetical protein